MEINITLNLKVHGEAGDGVGPGLGKTQNHASDYVLR